MPAISQRAIAPIWSPDGQSPVFASGRDGAPALYRKAADGTGPAEPLFSLDGVRQITPHDWTRDGTALLVAVDGLDDDLDIGLVSLEAPGSWEPLIHSEADEGAPSLMVAGEAPTGSADSPYDLIVVQNWLEELKRLVPTD